MIKHNSNYYFNPEETYDSEQLRRRLQKSLQEKSASWQNIVILCIGSDRLVGDCLGPLVGYKLNSYLHNCGSVFGTLGSTVNATNLEETVRGIYRSYCDPFIIVVDSSVGEPRHVGRVMLKNGSVAPGTAFNKNLPKVGDISILGIVACFGLSVDEFFRAVRMQMVIQMADFITAGLLETAEGRNEPVR